MQDLPHQSHRPRVLSCIHMPNMHNVVITHSPSRQKKDAKSIFFKHVNFCDNCLMIGRKGIIFFHSRIFALICNASQLVTSNYKLMNDSFVFLVFYVNYKNCNKTNITKWFIKKVHPSPHTKLHYLYYFGGNILWIFLILARLLLLLALYGFRTKKKPALIAIDCMLYALATHPWFPFVGN